MKRCLYLIAISVLVLSLSQVLAAFSPVMDTLESAFNSGETLSLDLTAEVTDWKALSAASLPAVRELLQNLSLHFNFSKRGESLKLVRLDNTIFNLQLTEAEGESRLVLPLQGLGFVSQDELGAEQMFMGNSKAAMLLALVQKQDLSFLADLPQAALARMGPFAQTQKRRTAIKAVGTSTEFVEYKLPADQWQKIWPYIMSTLIQSLPDEMQAIRKAISLIQFEKPVLLRRYLDDAGSAMGWHFDGKARFSQNDERNLSLTFGHQEGKGFSLSLKAPAVKGKNDLLLSFNFIPGKESLNADLQYESRLEKERYRLKGDVSLKNDLKVGEEHLSGTIWLEEKTGNEKTNRLTFKPDLVLKGGRASGTVQLTGQKAGKAELDVNFNVVLSGGKEEEISEPVKFVPLDDSPEAARKAVTQAILPFIRELLLTLPLPQRKLLLHDMGRTLRTQGESLPPAKKALTDYLVTDEPLKEAFP